MSSSKRLFEPTMLIGIFFLDVSVFLKNIWGDFGAIEQNVQSSNHFFQRVNTLFNIEPSLG